MNYFKTEASFRKKKRKKKTKILFKFSSKKCATCYVENEFKKPGF